MVPGSIDEHLLQHSLLLIFRDNVVEHGEDVGLLAEDLLVGVVGDESARGVPALAIDTRADMGSTGVVAGGEERVTESFLEVGGVIERAEVFQGGDAGFAVRIVGG